MLTTHIGSNISPLTAEGLAERAVESARLEAGLTNRDGISYLIDTKESGIITPLAEPYENEILRITGAETLTDAWSEVTQRDWPHRV